MKRCYPIQTCYNHDEEPFCRVWFYNDSKNSVVFSDMEIELYPRQAVVCRLRTDKTIKICSHGTIKINILDTEPQKKLFILADTQNQVSHLLGEYLREYGVPCNVDIAFLIVSPGKGDIIPSPPNYLTRVAR